MLNWLIRYSPVIRFIRAKKCASILEVGSGPKGIGEFFAHHFIGCDIYFGQDPNENMSPVRCSTLALPFDDNLFDVVISLDMLEHIQPEYRDLAINELIRLSKRYVIVGFPCGEKAKEIDVILYKWYIKAKKTVPDWLIEHLTTSFPSIEEIKSILASQDISYKIVNNENLMVHLLIMWLESMRLSMRALRWSSHKTRGLWELILPLLNFGDTYRKILFITKDCSAIP